VISKGRIAISNLSKRRIATSKGTIEISKGTIAISQAAVDHRYDNKQLDDIVRSSDVQ
jgi:hypothetical protein